MTYPEASDDQSRHSHSLWLTPKECQIILEIRAMQFGKIEVVIQGGSPVMIERIREHIKLQ